MSGSITIPIHLGLKPVIRTLGFSSLREGSAGAQVYEMATIQQIGWLSIVGE
jgi:hypothetical protein